MYTYILLFLGTMAPRSKKDEIQSMQTQLRDKAIDTEASPLELNVQPDEGIE